MDLRVKIKDTIFNNPIWVASGTFGYSDEFSDFLNIDNLGALVTKTVTRDAREGNPTPRIVETAAGLLNSIGLENQGIDYFLSSCGPFLKKTKTKVVISIAGSSIEDFKVCIEKIEKAKIADLIELNLSCPNVKHAAAKYKLIAQDADQVNKIVSALKKKTKLPLITKLTPNVTDIVPIAKAAEDGGTDAVSLVNTYLGMAVDAENMKPVLGNVVGGLSGPAIKPMALKAVWDVYNNVKVPIIGIGGITRGTDVAEFMLCGATCVQVGTANLADPSAYTRISKEFKEYLKRKKIKKAADLIGKLKKQG